MNTNESILFKKVTSAVQEALRENSHLFRTSNTRRTVIRAAMGAVVAITMEESRGNQTRASKMANMNRGTFLKYLKNSTQEGLDKDLSASKMRWL